MNTDTLRCPTCRAEQPWSDTCRRCKCDLRLLRDLASEYATRRKRCLLNLRHNQIRPALEQARQCFALHSGLDSQRLLAACDFLNGNWSSALLRAKQFLAENYARHEEELAKIRKRS